MATTPRLSTYLKERKLQEFASTLTKLNLSSTKDIASISNEHYNIIYDSLGIPPKCMKRVHFGIMINQIKNESHIITPSIQSNDNENLNKPLTTNKRRKHQNKRRKPLNTNNNINGLLNDDNQFDNTPQRLEGETETNEPPEQPPAKKRKIVEPFGRSNFSFSGSNNHNSFSGNYNHGGTFTHQIRNHNQQLMPNHDIQHYQKHLNRNGAIDGELEFYCKGKLLCEQKSRVGSPDDVYDGCKYCNLETIFDTYYHWLDNNQRSNKIRKMVIVCKRLLGKLERIMGWDNKVEGISMKNILRYLLTKESKDITLRDMNVLIMCLGNFDLDGKERIMREIIKQLKKYDGCNLLQCIDLKWKELEGMYGSSQLLSHLNKLDDAYKGMFKWYGIDYNDKYMLYKKYKIWIYKTNMNNNNNNNVNKYGKVYQKKAPYCAVCCVYVSGSWTAHINGRKHQSKINADNKSKSKGHKKY
eukprot:515215_1